MDKMPPLDLPVADLAQETMKLTQHESFFNQEPSDPKSTKQLWVKPQKSDYSESKSKVILEAPMEKQGKKTRFWKCRYYILTDEFLAYKEKQSSNSIRRVMLLDRVQLKCIEGDDSNKKKRFGFSFTKNKKTATIFTTDQHVYQRFKNELEKRCILTTFDENYRIEKLIGKGSFGKVYLVRSTSNNEPFAAKMFSKDSLLKQSKGKQSLVNEIKLLRRLNHPGIMKLYKVYETKAGIFLIMELLEGGELFEHLKHKKAFTERDCAFMLIRIMSPLAYMHEKNIVHRDIKPENLILRSKDDGYDIVIADFGLGQDLSQRALFVKCGSPGYCAPEILNAKKESTNNHQKITYNTKCDVFSVGCVFYHMITGKNPFWSKYPKETYNHNKTCVVNFDDEKITALSPLALDLLKRMLYKDPAQRPSFKECLDHSFFQEVFQITKSPVLTFSSKRLQRLNLSRKSAETDSKDRFFLSNGELQEELNSFVYGRSNIIKGKTDTLQEMSSSPTKTTKNLNQIGIFSDGFLPAGPNSCRVQLVHDRDYSKEALSFEQESLNDSCEIGRLAWLENPREIESRVSKMKNFGKINNPFGEVPHHEKDMFWNVKKEITSYPTKQSFLMFPSQAGLSTKSEENSNLKSINAWPNKS